MVVVIQLHEHVTLDEVKKRIAAKLGCYPGSPHAIGAQEPAVNWNNDVQLYCFASLNDDRWNLAISVVTAVEDLRSNDNIVLCFG